MDGNVELEVALKLANIEEQVAEIVKSMTGMKSSFEVVNASIAKLEKSSDALASTQEKIATHTNNVSQAADIIKQKYKDEQEAADALNDSMKNRPQLNAEQDYKLSLKNPRVLKVHTR